MMKQPTANLDNLKRIHIGEYIDKRAHELDISVERIASFLGKNIEDVFKIYKSESLETGVLLRISKLLDYDFFRIYSQHLILYSPSNSLGFHKKEKLESSLPQFRKNIYTKEIIGYILELLQTGEKTKQQIIDEYNIPKTTLYKWVSKYEIKQNNGMN